MNRLQIGTAWAVIHSLWEGGLIAIVLRGFFAVSTSSRARYAAACAALLMMAAAFVLTFAYEVPTFQSGGHRTVLSPLLSPTPVTSNGKAGGSFEFENMLPWISVVWLSGVFAFSIKHAAGYFAAWRMRHRGVCSAPEVWQVRLDALRIRAGVRKSIQLLESSLATVPAVIGHFRPVILIPLGIISGMPADQIESILLHELAHIRRYDYAVNVIRSIAESFLFYHPCAWWISKKIRIEREHCCDDFVVAATGDARAYAAALTALEEKRARHADLAIAASGGNLVNRIHRLLDPPKTSATAFLPPVLAVLLVVMGAIVVAAWPAQTNHAESRLPAPIQPLLAGAAPPAAAVPRRVRQNPAETVHSTQQWLDQDVVYIITPEERAAFESLPTDEERAHFIEQFWQRRDPTPGTPENEFKDEHHKRIAYANEHFSFGSTQGWKSDRGRVLITWGKPDEIESHASGMRPGGQTSNSPFEIWLYRYIETLGNNIIIEFVDETGAGDFRRVASVPTPSQQPTATAIRNEAPAGGYIYEATVLEDRLAALERQNAELAVTFRPDYPLRRRITAQIDEIRSVLKSAPRLIGVPVLGAVRIPGVYRVRGQKKLLDLIAFAGGLDSNAGNTIEIIYDKGLRLKTVQVRELFGGNADDNPDIAEGDIIRVVPQ